MVRQLDNVRVSKWFYDEGNNEKFLFVLKFPLISFSNALATFFSESLVWFAVFQWSIYCMVISDTTHHYFVLNRNRVYCSIWGNFGNSFCSKYSYIYWYFCYFSCPGFIDNMRALYLAKNNFQIHAFNMLTHVISLLGSLFETEWLKLFLLVLKMILLIL